jgi:hypothetical protein
MAVSTILEGLQNFLKAYSELEDDAPLWVNRLRAIPISYSIQPLAGDDVLEEYINGNRLMTYPFAFLSMESVASDIERLNNYGFFELFKKWLKTQTDDGNFPEMPDGCYPELIEATGWAYLMQEGDSETAIYHVQCRLVYEEQTGA